MAVLTSQQLNKILDINAKSVEIYLEVEGKYSEILEDIEEMKRIIENVGFENKEHIKEQYLHIERMRNITEKLQQIADSNCKAISNQNAEILANKKDIIDSIDKIEKGITKQNYVFAGTIVTAILAAVVKFIFGV